MKKLYLALLCGLLIGCQGKDVSLFNAAQAGNVKSVQKLITGGANVNFNEGNGWTPLMIAAAEDHADVVKVLLENGAHPNAQNQYGRTALHYATNYTLEPIVKLLLDYGADPTIKTYQNFGEEPEPETAFDAALRIFVPQFQRSNEEKQAAYNILKMFAHKTEKMDELHLGLCLALANYYKDKDFANYLIGKGAKRLPPQRAK
ncbi:MAG: ankyrin repeat domain-containing protein [Elusimicrobiaceae bacterium]|nr:ankyrin repeat domain-containing protein [Elusimicrobiaceae bacterium]